ncbi:MAG: hypothetical protein KDA24_29650, partial [Deltaproteobacteria bacterium]|nr:hypothetical protein [Deltaproteobacteria bacterium]
MSIWPRIALLLLIGLVLALWTGRHDFVPAGPGADDPGFGAGSDWDVQWAQGDALRSSWERGELPHWDPMPDFGAPLLAHPEAWVAAPSYLVFGGTRDVASGLHGLRIVSVIALVLGLGLLCVRLEVPSMVGVATAVGVLASFEWEQRLYSGHVMMLGICWWPLAAAAVLEALKRPTRSGRILVAGGAGAAIGMASLQGAHYPTVLAPLVLGLVAWAAVAGERWVAALVGLFAAGVLIPWGAPALSAGVSVAAGAVLL